MSTINTTTTIDMDSLNDQADDTKEDNVTTTGTTVNTTKEQDVKNLMKMKKAQMADTIIGLQQENGELKEMVRDLSESVKTLTSRVSDLADEVAKAKVKPEQITTQPPSKEALMDYLCKRMGVRRESHLWQQAVFESGIDNDHKFVEVAFPREYYLVNQSACNEFLVRMKQIAAKRKMRVASPRGCLRIYFN